MTLIPSDLWSKPVETIREFSYLEEGSLDGDELRPKANNNKNNDSVRPVVQTSGNYPGIQLSRGGKPRLRRIKT